MKEYLKKIYIISIIEKILHIRFVQKKWDDYCAQKHANKMKAKRSRMRKKTRIRRALKRKCARRRRSTERPLSQPRPHLPEHKTYLLYQKIIKAKNINQLNYKTHSLRPML